MVVAAKHMGGLRGNPRKRHSKANFAGSGMSGADMAVRDSLAGAYPDPRMKKERAYKEMQRPRGGLGGPPKRNWGRTAALAMSALSELDPANRGSTMYMRDRFDQSDERSRLRAEEEARKARFGKALENVGMPGMGGLSPEQMSFLYGVKRDGVMDARDERNFNRAGDWRAEDIQRGSTERKQDIERQEARWDVEDGFAQQRIAQADRGLDLQETSFNAQIEATKRENEAIDVDGEGSLRTEFNKLTDGFRDTYAAYGRLMESDGTTAPGQMSLVFQYMKMMDPGSTVREGEFANAENTRGVPGHVRAAYNKARSGLILGDTQVQEFKDQAAALYASEEQIYANQMRHYQGLATDYGLDVDRTIIDVRVPQFDDFGTGAPIEAVRDLLADPTPMAREEFDQIFGPGAAGKIIVGYGG